MKMLKKSSSCKFCRNILITLYLHTKFKYVIKNLQEPIDFLKNIKILLDLNFFFFLLEKCNFHFKINITILTCDSNIAPIFLPHKVNSPNF